MACPKRCAHIEPQIFTKVSVSGWVKPGQQHEVGGKAFSVPAFSWRGSAFSSGSPHSSCTVQRGHGRCHCPQSACEHAVTTPRLLVAGGPVHKRPCGHGLSRPAPAWFGHQFQVDERLAPWRRLVPTQSDPVSPPPRSRSRACPSPEFPRPDGFAEHAPRLRQEIRGGGPSSGRGYHPVEGGSWWSRW